MKKLKGAVVGCGMISKYHLMGWQRLENVEIKALVSRNTDNAKKRIEFAPGATIYSDYLEALEKEDLDFVDILTPPHVHAWYCLEAKKRGIHIICQKPITDNLDDAHTLVNVFEGYDKLFAIHENHRYRPWFTDMQQKLKEGFFGEKHYVHIQQLNPSEPDVAYKLAMKEGVLLEHGTHLVDMTHALFGTPLRTYARLHHMSKKLTGENFAHVMFEYPETTVCIDVGWKPGGVQQASFLLTGDEGEAYYQGSMVRGGDSRYRLMNGKEVVLDEQRNSADDYVESFYLFEKECTELMLNGNVHQVTQSGAENIKSLASTFAAYESAYTSSIMEIKSLEKVNLGILK
ncbi:MAG: Gfo/Idh/MocA family oxidoreductase [Fibrobacteria bacterium]|nr:Gfo/Idh/MocA family oxidoreductase [Fibrobacteria bacterium]